MLSIVPLVREGIYEYREEWTSSQIHEEIALVPHSSIKMGTQQTQAGTPGVSIFSITSIPIKNAGTHNTADLHPFFRENNLLS